MSAKGKEHGGEGTGDKRGPSARPSAYCWPFGLLTAATSIFLSAGTELDPRLSPQTLLITALCRGLHYHSDQLNHQQFPPPPSQTNPSQSFLPKISSARGSPRPAARSGNGVNSKMYLWQMWHTKTTTRSRVERMVIHWKWHPGVLFEKSHSWQSVCLEGWWNGQRRHVFSAPRHIRGDS